MPAMVTIPARLLNWPRCHMKIEAPKIRTTSTTATGWPMAGPLEPLLAATPLMVFPATGIPFKRHHALNDRQEEASNRQCDFRQRSTVGTFAAGDLEQQGAGDDEARRQHPRKARDE